MRNHYTTTTFQTPDNRAGITFKIKSPLLCLAYHDSMLLVAKYLQLSVGNIAREVTSTGRVEVKHTLTNQILGTIKVS